MKIPVWVYIVLVINPFLWAGNMIIEWVNEPDLNQKIELVAGCVRAGFDQYREIDGWIVCVPKNQ